MEHSVPSTNTMKPTPHFGINYLTLNEQSNILVNETIQQFNDDKICVSWKKLTVAILFCFLIIITIIGNTLVILSVVTTRRLRTGKEIQCFFFC